MNSDRNKKKNLSIYLHLDCLLKERRKIRINMPMDNISGYFEVYHFVIDIQKKIKHP